MINHIHLRILRTILKISFRFSKSKINKSCQIVQNNRLVYLFGMGILVPIRFTPPPCFLYL